MTPPDEPRRPGDDHAARSRLDMDYPVDLDELPDAAPPATPDLGA